jgi:hypothetical protein
MYGHLILKDFACSNSALCNTSSSYYIIMGKHAIRRISRTRLAAGVLLLRAAEAQITSTNPTVTDVTCVATVSGSTITGQHQAIT